MKNDNSCDVGIVLWEALAEFSNKNLWEEYVTYTDELVKGGGSFSPVAENPSAQDLFIGLQKITSTFINNINREKELFNKLTNQFKSKFKSQKLFAYGYALPRKAENKPYLIPIDVIANGKINWSNSSIKGNGIEFVGIMVLKAQLINELNETSNSISNEKGLNDKSKKRKGRPSHKELIKRIYLIQKEKGNIDFSLSKKEIFENLGTAIAEKVDISFNNEAGHFDGLGYEAINNAIGHLVDKEKDKLSS